MLEASSHVTGATTTPDAMWVPGMASFHVGSSGGKPFSANQKGKILDRTIAYIKHLTAMTSQSMHWLTEKKQLEEQLLFMNDYSGRMKRQNEALRDELRQLRGLYDVAAAATIHDNGIGAMLMPHAHGDVLKRSAAPQDIIEMKRIRHDDS